MKVHGANSLNGKKNSQGGGKTPLIGTAPVVKTSKLPVASTIVLDAMSHSVYMGASGSKQINEAR